MMAINRNYLSGVFFIIFFKSVINKLYLLLLQMFCFWISGDLVGQYITII